jgi:hypothetical protein
MPTSLAFVLWLAAALGASPPESARAVSLVSPPPGELVERVLAVVDGRPLLLSDARVLAEVRGTSSEHALELLVDESLMYEQASRTPQAAIAPGEEQAALADLLQKRPSLANESTAAALRRLLRRQLAILKYVDFRFGPQVRPTDEELQRAYAQEYGARPEAPALETVAEALRARLTREKADARLEAWIKELRADAEVRYVPSSN